MKNLRKFKTKVDGEIFAKRISEHHVIMATVKKGKCEFHAINPKGEVIDEWNPSPSKPVLLR